MENKNNYKYKFKVGQIIEKKKGEYLYKVAEKINAPFGAFYILKLLNNVPNDVEYRFFGYLGVYDGSDKYHVYDAEVIDERCKLASKTAKLLYGEPPKKLGNPFHNK